MRIKTSHRLRFPTRYTRADVELLAQVDEAHETLSGPATRCIFEREFGCYGMLEFQRLAAISNGHLYNLITDAAPRAIASASRITKQRGHSDNTSPGKVNFTTVSSPGLATKRLSSDVGVT